MTVEDDPRLRIWRNVSRYHREHGWLTASRLAELVAESVHRYLLHLAQQGQVDERLGRDPRVVDVGETETCAAQRDALLKLIYEAIDPEMGWQSADQLRTYLLEGLERLPGRKRPFVLERSEAPVAYVPFTERDVTKSDRQVVVEIGTLNFSPSELIFDVDEAGRVLGVEIL